MHAANSMYRKLTEIVEPETVKARDLFTLPLMVKEAMPRGL